MQIQVKLKRGGRVRDSFTVDVPAEIEHFTGAHDRVDVLGSDALNFAGIRVAVELFVSNLMTRRRTADTVQMILTDDQAMLDWLNRAVFIFEKGDCHPVVRARSYGQRSIGFEQELMKQELVCDDAVYLPCHSPDRPVLMRSSVRIMWKKHRAWDNAQKLFRRYARRIRYTCIDVQRFHRDVIALSDRLETKHYRPHLHRASLWTVLSDAGLTVGHRYLDNWSVWIDGNFYDKVGEQAFKTLQMIHEMILLGEKAA